MARRLRQPLIPLLVLAGLLVACSDRQPGALELSGQTMGTTWSVKSISSHEATQLQARIDATLDSINNMMSTYLVDSALSMFNANPSTEWQAAPAELVEVVRAARQISELSGGAFDVTVGPLVNLWGFGSDPAGRIVPNEQHIQRELERVGYQKLEHRGTPPALRKSVSSLYVDLSAIAKGYGVDRVAELLEAEGIDDFLVEIGGEVRSKGVNASGKPWRIAIEKPDGLGRAIYQVVPLRDSSMATSGDYRNFFMDQGQRYSHTIDVRTGKPVDHSLASVTVVAETCMRADGLATALASLGPRAGFDLAERHGIAALFIERTQDGFRDMATRSFKKMLEGQPDNA